MDPRKVGETLAGKAFLRMMEKARFSLAALRGLAPQLCPNDPDTAQLKNIERKLNRLKLYTAIELERLIQRGNIKNRCNEEGESCGLFSSAWALAYGKDRRGRWCFLVRQYEIDEISQTWLETEVIPLLQAPRDLRLAAAKRLPELLKAVEEAVERQRSTSETVTRKR